MVDNMRGRGDRPRRLKPKRLLGLSPGDGTNPATVAARFSGRRGSEDGMGQRDIMMNERGGNGLRTGCSPSPLIGAQEDRKY